MPSPGPRNEESGASMSAVRQWLLGGLVALVVICATVLASLQVVDGGRVLDLLGVVVASFLGGMAGANVRASSASQPLRPPGG